MMLDLESIRLGIGGSVGHGSKAGPMSVFLLENWYQPVTACSYLEVDASELERGRHEEGDGAVPQDSLKGDQSADAEVPFTHCYFVSLQNHPIGAGVNDITRLNQYVNISQSAYSAEALHHLAPAESRGASTTPDSAPCLNKLEWSCYRVAANALAFGIRGLLLTETGLPDPRSLCLARDTDAIERTRGRKGARDIMTASTSRPEGQKTVIRFAPNTDVFPANPQSSRQGNTPDACAAVRRSFSEPPSFAGSSDVFEGGERLGEGSDQNINLKDEAPQTPETLHPLMSLEHGGTIDAAPLSILAPKLAGQVSADFLVMFDTGWAEILSFSPRENVHRIRQAFTLLDPVEAVSVDRLHGYVCLASEDMLAVYDPASTDVVAEIPLRFVGQNVYALAVGEALTGATSRPEARGDADDPEVAADSLTETTGSQASRRSKRSKSSQLSKEGGAVTLGEWLEADPRTFRSPSSSGLGMHSARFSLDQSQSIAHSTTCYGSGGGVARRIVASTICFSPTAYCVALLAKTGALCLVDLARSTLEVLGLLNPGLPEPVDLFDHLSQPKAPTGISPAVLAFSPSGSHLLASIGTGLFVSSLHGSKAPRKLRGYACPVSQMMCTHATVAGAQGAGRMEILVELAEDGEIRLTGLEALLTGGPYRSLRLYARSDFSDFLRGHGMESMAWLGSKAIGIGVSASKALAGPKDPRPELLYVSVADFHLDATPLARTGPPGCSVIVVVSLHVYTIVDGTPRLVLPFFAFREHVCLPPNLLKELNESHHTDETAKSQDSLTPYPALAAHVSRCSRVRGHPLLEDITTGAVLSAVCFPDAEARMCTTITSVPFSLLSQSIGAPQPCNGLLAGLEFHATSLSHPKEYLRCRTAHLPFSASAVELLPAQHRIVVTPDGGKASLVYSWNPLPFFTLEEALRWSGAATPATAYNSVSARLAEELISLRSLSHPTFGASGVDVSEPEKGASRISSASASPRADVVIHRDGDDAVVDSVAEVRGPVL